MRLLFYLEKKRNKTCGKTDSQNARTNSKSTTFFVSIKTQDSSKEVEHQEASHVLIKSSSAAFHLELCTTQGARWIKYQRNPSISPREGLPSSGSLSTI